MVYVGNLKFLLDYLKNSFSFMMKYLKYLLFKNAKKLFKILTIKFFKIYLFELLPYKFRPQPCGYSIHPSVAVSIKYQGGIFSNTHICISLKSPTVINGIPHVVVIDSLRYFFLDLLLLKLL
jgi:hypothetical protein